jgi:hypothetical protein
MKTPPRLLPDLPTLTEFRPKCQGAHTDPRTGEVALFLEYADRCLRARWPNGAPVDFKRTLAAARIYLQFRWAGDQPEKTLREKTLRRFQHLRAASKQLGLLQNLSS